MYFSTDFEGGIFRIPLGSGIDVLLGIAIGVTMDINKSILKFGYKIQILLVAD
jgi:hypothetical protein